MTQTRQLGAVLMGLAVLAALITWLWGHRAPSDLASVKQPVSSVAVQAKEGEEAATPVSAGASSQARAAPVACPDQSIEISIGKQTPNTSCLNRTQTIQNGNIRAYRADGQSRDAPSLLTDAAGESILRVELVYPDGGKFSCLRSKCRGVSVGPYDAQGARSLRFKDAKLVRGGETARVTATLRTMPDDQLASTTCTAQLLYINIGEGTVHFCPDGGSGFELQDDGSTMYRFTNADGNTLSVGVTRQGVLQSVEYKTFSCRSPRCAGAGVSHASAQGRRNFTFHGTVLIEQGGNSAAILSGNVVLAPQ